jgi:lysine/ornithine N-monooxygenase
MKKHNQSLHSLHGATVFIRVTIPNLLWRQNTELHGHGINSANFGMGAYRNAIILHSILGT